MADAAGPAEAVYLAYRASGPLAQAALLPELRLPCDLALAFLFPTVNVLLFALLAISPPSLILAGDHLPVIEQADNHDSAEDVSQRCRQ